MAPTYRQPAHENSWPRLTYEQLEWTPSELSDGGLSERERARLRSQLAGPYRSAIVPPIAQATLEVSPDVRVAASDAQHEIARFDAELGHEIAPFAAILLRTEAAASSQIENLSSSAKAIELAMLGDRQRSNATLIARNAQAMTAAVALADDLSEQAILRMHTELLSEVDPKIAGRWRDCPVWIGTSSRTPIGAEYVAPHQDRVPTAIVDLVEFMRRDDLPVLEHAAVAHAQFETIHPFADGNGRVGRALLHSMLRNKELTRHVTVPVSAGLLADVEQYHAALMTYRDGDPGPIVDLTARASLRAITNGRQLVAELNETRERWTELVTARSDSSVWRVLDLLLRHPVLTVELLGSEAGIDSRHAHRYLNPLVDAGILQQAKLTKRTSCWAAGDVLSALDRFAERAGRRLPAP